jgi:hypothetical protein
MPNVGRPAKFPHAVAVAAPSFCVLSACVAVLLLLAVPQAAQAAACGPSASGAPTPGCSAGTAGSKLAGLANAVHKPASPVAPGTPAAPCVPGATGAGMAGCGGGTMGAIMPGMANARPNFFPGMGAIQPGPCAPGVRREGMPDCNAGTAGAVVQGVMTFMQMMAPIARPTQMMAPAAPPPH